MYAKKLLSSIQQSAALTTIRTVTPNTIGRINSYANVHKRQGRVEEQHLQCQCRGQGQICSMPRSRPGQFKAKAKAKATKICPRGASSLRPVLEDPIPDNRGMRHANKKIVAIFFLVANAFLSQFEMSAIG